MNVLITSAGRRVSLVKFFKEEAFKINPKIKIFTTDLNPQMSAACFTAHCAVKSLSVLDEKYPDFLLKLCIDNNITLVIPTLDTELLVLAKVKKQFKSNGVDIVISDEAFVKTCRDKRISNGMFEELGFLVPEKIDINNPTFPMFIKPYDGSLSKNIFVINSPEELNAIDISNEKLMFMEYLNPSLYDEYSIDAYFDKNQKLVAFVPRLRIEIRGGEISKGVCLKELLYDTIREKLEKIKGAIGCLTIQVFHQADTNEIYGIEINPRFGGGYPLTHHSGANYVKNILEEYLKNIKLNFNDAWQNKTTMLRFDQEIILNEKGNLCSI